MNDTIAMQFRHSSGHIGTERVLEHCVQVDVTVLEHILETSLTAVTHEDAQRGRLDAHSDHGANINVVELTNLYEQNMTRSFDIE